MIDETTPLSRDIGWEIEVPLLQGDVVGGLARVFAVSAFLMAGLLSLIMATTGELEAVLPIWAGSIAIAGTLFLLSLLICAVVFRGHMRFRYRLDSAGLSLELIDSTARAANRAAILAGLITGRAGTLGSGLVAVSRETSEVAWGGAFTARFDPRRRTVTLRNGWRELMVVYAAEKNYPAVAERIRAEMTAHRADSAERRRPSPLPQVLALSVAATAASLAVFPLSDSYPFEVSLLLPITILCFALAMIWLVSLFAWVVIGVVVLVFAQVIVSLAAVHESFFEAGVFYNGLDLLGSDDQVVLGLGLAGMAVLVGLAVAALRGKLPSMLERDAEDAGA